MLRPVFRPLGLVLFLSAALVFNLNSFAEDPPETPPPSEKPSPSWNIEQGIELPIGKTQWEIEHEHLFEIIYPTDDPPPQPVVNPGEWERMTGVLIRYPLGLSYSLIVEMAEDIEVMTIVSSLSQMQTVYHNYQSNGVNVANCTWLIAPSNSMWTRDYGPWYIFTGEDIQGITDHIYNRPSRPHDNNIPWVLGDTLDIPVYGMPVIHAGGNHMGDGMGVSMSTNLVYNENPNYTQTEVDEFMLLYVGAEDYDVLPDILSGGIHHIDCWAKMIDPGRLMVKRLDPPNATLEANVEYWESKMSPYGKPYEVIRIDCASSTPYTNALILNTKVLVPLFNHPLDAQAMQTWAEAMPGYEILGFTGGWVSNDAIHCRTMGMTDRYMLRIVHVPLGDRENNGEDYLVEADIHPYSDQSISPGFPLIWWKTGGGTFTSAPMTFQGDDIYQGYIPQQPDYSSLQYYIQAEDGSGRSETHPFIGAGNPHSFRVIPDTIPPEIAHHPLPDLSIYEWPPTITAVVTDNMGVGEVYVEYALNGMFQPNVALTPAGNVYTGQLEGNVQVGDIFEYRIAAVDISLNSNTSYNPETGMYQCNIVPGFFFDIEDGTPGWAHGVVLPGFNDEWHLSTQRNHTPGGIQSWKCGDTGTGNYGNFLDAGLETEQYYLENASHLSFWHWMEAEASSSYPGYAYDGGLVEISVNGGDWTQVTPIGGYPYLVRVGSNPGPFPAETPIFSGNTGGWEQVVFNLSGISGDVSFRFRFGSDGSETEEGWYIDDVLIVDSGGGSPIATVMMPVNPPIIIPSGGGRFDYALEIYNISTATHTFDAWIEAMLPDSSIYGPIILRNLTLLPGGRVERNLNQTIPGNAPAGDYLFLLKVGEYPGIVWSSDSFPFVKE